jgi:hypothetical protein
MSKFYSLKSNLQINDKKAFLFSLKNHEDKPFKVNQRIPNGNYSLYHKKNAIVK